VTRLNDKNDAEDRALSGQTRQTQALKSQISLGVERKHFRQRTRLPTGNNPQYNDDMILARWTCCKDGAPRR
jgi:hypothetical protein